MSTPAGAWALRSALLALGALAPVWRMALQRRLARGKETARSVDEKLMRRPAARPPGPLVWGHAVGVGEALALAGVFARLAERLPDHHFLITTTARTSGEALARIGLPPRCLHQFSPIDTPATTRAFLAHWRPSLAVWCEMDLWPALIDATRRAGVPMVLVNARLSPASLDKRRWGRALYAALLPAFDTLYAQNAASAQGLALLGAPTGRVQVSGSIKVLAPPMACDEAELVRLRAAVGARRVWVLASSHPGDPGEESLGCAAHAALRQRHPDALLIIAPRAPARGEAVVAEAVAAELTAVRRSTGEALQPDTAVYVADTIGEMGLWYRLGRIALVGGSLVPVGGHNPLEALALGCAVLHGPQVANFSEIYADLAAQGAPCDAVQDTESIVRAVERAWTAEGGATARPTVPPAALAVLDRLQTLATPAPGADGPA